MRETLFGFRRHRRARLLATPLPEAWWRIIDERVPLVRAMSAEDRAELGGTVQVLIAEKTFEGCGGLQMTEEIKVTIAAQAAVLLLHRDTRYYPSLQTILVYPAAYVAPATVRQPDGTVVEGPQPRLGESWHRGALVVSWDDVVRGAENAGDGHNVVLHEFAHQLDGEDGPMDGAPPLGSRARYREWARVLGQEYAELAESLHRGHHQLLDDHAATNPPEFFAVATELFFERPAAMKARYPELYRQLAEFYAQDPASRT